MLVELIIVVFEVYIIARTLKTLEVINVSVLLCEVVSPVNGVNWILEFLQISNTLVDFSILMRTIF